MIAVPESDRVDSCCGEAIAQSHRRSMKKLLARRACDGRVTGARFGSIRVDSGRRTRRRMRQRRTKEAPPRESLQRGSAAIPQTFSTRGRGGRTLVEHLVADGEPSLGTGGATPHAEGYRVSVRLRRC